MLKEQETVFKVEELLALLSTEERAHVDQTCVALTRILCDAGTAGPLALALVGANFLLAAAHVKHLGDAHYVPEVRQ